MKKNQLSCKLNFLSQCSLHDLESINESTHAKYHQIPQQIFQISQSLLATRFSNANEILGVFDNFVEVLKVDGGLCYSTCQVGIFSSNDCLVNI